MSKCIECADDIKDHWARCPLCSRKSCYYQKRMRRALRTAYPDLSHRAAGRIVGNVPLSILETEDCGQVREWVRCQPAYVVGTWYMTGEVIHGEIIRGLGLGAST